MKTYTWVLCLWVCLALIIIAYLWMGIHQINQTDDKGVRAYDNIVFVNPKVKEALEKIDKFRWTDVCPVKDAEKGKKSYFDCGGEIEKQTEELKKEIISFGEKTTGIFIFKVNIHISEETWNLPRIVIDMIGMDIFWIFRENPPISTSPKPRAPSAAASFFIPRETMSTPKLLLPRPLSKPSPLLAKLHRW